MAGIIERLTEGVVNRDMRAEGSALLSKWEKTGLLEGIDSDRQRQSMARLLENQAKELLRESSSMSAGDVEGFAAVAFPIVRRVFAGLIANDLVSVQPMSLPSGLIFFLDFVFSGDRGDGTTEPRRMGNNADKSVYGTDQVGSQITGGVDLVGATSPGSLSGPRNSARGYAYASPTGSNDIAVGNGRLVASFAITASMQDSDKKLIDYDPDILAKSTDNGTATHAALVIEISSSAFNSNIDLYNLSAISASAGCATFGGALVQTPLLGNTRRLTKRVPAEDTDLFKRGNAAATEAIRLVVVGRTGSSTDEVRTSGNSEILRGAALEGAEGVIFPLTDKLQASDALGSIVGATDWGLEGATNIPEIDIKVDSIAVTAQTKKLKAKWTPELGQDLNAYHNLDAEVELTSILSEQIALEIDREILADLVNEATADTRYWARAPGLFVDSNGAEIGASTKAPDFTGTVSEWYETLVETINDVSAQIHRKTLRGGANFVVCGPEVANILEFTAGFRASVTHDDETGSIGAVQVGSLSKKFDVIVDPYFLRNVLLVGRRGNSFLESGYVYAPYVPLQTTPTIFGPEDFVPRKGVMTRYAKKMVRPDMYGLVIVRGLLGESGS